jgi:hypothetical protein
MQDLALLASPGSASGSVSSPSCRPPPV